jgi:hypothetical protein
VIITNCKGFGRKRSWPDFNVLIRYSREKPSNTTEILSQDSQSPGRGLNPVPPEYEAGVLNTRPLRSVVYSSGSIVSDYRLENWTTGVRYPAEAKDFSSSLCVQTSSETHPASYPVGTGGPFPGVKGGRVVTLTTPTHLVPRSRMIRSYTPTPHCRLHGGSGTAFDFTFTVVFLMESKNEFSATCCDADVLP